MLYKQKPTLSEAYLSGKNCYHTKIKYNQGSNS